MEIGLEIEPPIEDTDLKLSSNLRWAALIQVALFYIESKMWGFYLSKVEHIFQQMNIASSQWRSHLLKGGPVKRERSLGLQLSAWVPVRRQSHENKKHGLWNTRNVTCKDRMMAMGRGGLGEKGLRKLLHRAPEAKLVS